MSVGFLRLASTIHYRNGNGHVLFDRHNDGKIQILPKCKKEKKKEKKCAFASIICRLEGIKQINFSITNKLISESQIFQFARSIKPKVLVRDHQHGTVLLTGTKTLSQIILIVEPCNVCVTSFLLRRLHLVYFSED